jgi:uncharacterized protein (TIGR03437 family)
MKVTNRFIVIALMPLLAGSGALVGEGRAQNKAAIVGSGASNPVPFSVAPGEITTIFAVSLSPPAPLPATAQSVPLLTTLAGISASIPLSSDSLAVPIISVFTVPTCSTQVSPPCSTLTGIRLQIPFGIPVSSPGTLNATVPVHLVVSDQAGNSTAVDIGPAAPDDIHVLVVTHADGSLVSKAAPAKAGEVLVAYAVGLGLTNPQVGTGQATSSPAPRTIASFAINYAFSPNAAPSRGLISTSSPTPLFTGLSPGSVGLYQLNFILPSPPAGTPACDGVDSNLTVTFVGQSSFDGAPICVAAP